jgi:hypothetical protein
MVRVLVISLLIISVFLGCKSPKKAATYVSPHTDTIKVMVNYQADSVEVFVKKIIENDSLFNINERGVDFSIVEARQQDSLLFVTIKGYSGCAKMEFDLYQSSFVFKSYPPRLRMRLAKTKQSECDGENSARVYAFTEVFDIRKILNEYQQANVVFSGSRTVATLKK